MNVKAAVWPFHKRDLSDKPFVRHIGTRRLLGGCIYTTSVKTICCQFRPIPIPNRNKTVQPTGKSCVLAFLGVPGAR